MLIYQGVIITHKKSLKHDTFFTAGPRLEDQETCMRGLREQLQVLRNPLNQLILLGADFDIWVCLKIVYP